MADDWKNKLTKEQYAVLRQKGTELPFSGKLLYNDKKGVYSCVACGNPLFSSDTKFEANTPGLTGWPAFNSPIRPDAIKLSEDMSQGMKRVEVTCGKCGGHLGHMFEAAPDQPTGLDYCINSVALDFDENSKS